MVDRGLVSDLDEAASHVGGVIKLPDAVGDAYISRLAEMYICNPLSLRWWTCLNADAKVISYGDSDGLSVLAEMVSDKREAILVVTDDDSRPWPVYSGDALSLINMLKNVRFFEYILAGEDMSWVAFDTHLNEIVSVNL